jgi:hypothetical protein
MSYAPTQQMTPNRQAQTNNHNAGKWKHGLCSCCDDCGLCM